MRWQLNCRVFTYTPHHDQHFSGQTQIKRKAFPGVFQPNVVFIHGYRNAEALRSIALRLCVYTSVWLWRKQNSVRVLWRGPTSRLNVTPVTSDGPLRCRNNAAGAVNMTVNVVLPPTHPQVVSTLPYSILTERQAAHCCQFGRHHFILIPLWWFLPCYI